MNSNRYTSLAYLLLIPTLKLLYFFFNRLPRPATVITIPFDNLIPVIPAFVLPYLAFYPFVLCSLIFLYLHHLTHYIHTILSYAAGLIICYITYLTWQTTVPRPELTSPDIFSTLLAFIYRIDAPYNCLPSIHVLGTLLIMLALTKTLGDKALWPNLLGILIILSTLFTKQHGVLDVAAGAVLAVGCYWIVGASRKFVPRGQEASQ
jgi:membrane-associated phospholipid phosphatase